MRVSRPEITQSCPHLDLCTIPPHWPRLPSADCAVGRLVRAVLTREGLSGQCRVMLVAVLTREGLLSGQRRVMLVAVLTREGLLSGQRRVMLVAVLTREGLLSGQRRIMKRTSKKPLRPFLPQQGRRENCF